MRVSSVYFEHTVNTLNRTNFRVSYNMQYCKEYSNSEQKRIDANFRRLRGKLQNINIFLIHFHLIKVQKRINLMQNNFSLSLS